MTFVDPYCITPTRVDLIRDGGSIHVVGGSGLVVRLDGGIGSATRGKILIGTYGMKPRQYRRATDDERRRIAQSLSLYLKRNDARWRDYIALVISAARSAT